MFFFAELWKGNGFKEKINEKIILRYGGKLASESRTSDPLK